MSADVHSASTGQRTYRADSPQPDEDTFLVDDSQKDKKEEDNTFDAGSLPKAILKGLRLLRNSTGVLARWPEAFDRLSRSIDRRICSPPTQAFQHPFKLEKHCH